MAKVIFLQNIWYEQLGVMALSAMVKSGGHDCDMGVFNKVKDAAAFAINGRPDLLAMSCTTGSHVWALNVAHEFKKHLDKPVILGGSHPTYFPEIVEDSSVDIICRGEGEYALLDLMNAIENGKDYTDIDNLWVKRKGVVHKNTIGRLVDNLDDLPFPDRSIFYQYNSFKINRVKHFMIARGCPYNCSYCFNESMRKLYKGKGKYLRHNSIDYSFEEIRKAKELAEIEVINFHDDTFYVNKKFYDEYMRRYKDEIGIPFICQLRPNWIDEEMVRHLKEANCSTVHMGVESASERVRKEILKRNISNDQIVNAVNILHKFDIPVTTFNLLGIPGESIEDAFNTIAFNRKLKVHSRYHVLTPYPNTAIYDYMQKHAFIVGDIDINKTSYFSDSLLKQKMYREIENLHKISYIVTMFPSLKYLVRQLIKLPRNIIFDLFFLVCFGLHYSSSSRLGFYNTLKFGLKNLTLYFGTKH